MAAQGRKLKLPPGPKHVMGVYLTEETHKRLVQRAAAMALKTGKQVTMGALIRQALDKLLESKP